MRTSGLLLCAAAVLLPAIALADDSTMSAAATNTAARTWDPNRVECSYLYFEATVVRRPICMTAAEWVANRERTQRNVREIQLRSLVSPQ
jgi:hypothetical protein